MKINQKILSVPPYISTSWKNVLSLQLRKKEGKSYLAVGLINGTIIEVPELEQAVIDAIFAAHEKYMEQENAHPSKNTSNSNSVTGPIYGPSSVIGIPLRFGVDGIEGLGTLLQHNPEASDTPELPKEVLEKIATLSKVVGLDRNDSFPKAEPHCNCMHCQILRAIHLGMTEHAEEVSVIEEEVTAEDLKFRDWDIEQTAEKLYLVKNPLHQEEHYNVFLGNPVGCTCGEKNCEHIRAVLNS